MYSSRWWSAKTELKEGECGLTDSKWRLMLFLNCRMCKYASVCWQFTPTSYTVCQRWPKVSFCRFRCRLTWRVSSVLPNDDAELMQSWCSLRGITQCANIKRKWEEADVFETWTEVYNAYRDWLTVCDWFDKWLSEHYARIFISLTNAHVPWKASRSTVSSSLWYSKISASIASPCQRNLQRSRLWVENAWI